MALDAITRDRVRDALRAIRYANPVPDSALLDLDLVSCRLRAEDLADTRRARAWALGRCLADVVVAELLRLRGASPAGLGAAEITAETEIAELRQDLLSGHAERLDWALLHWRYLSLTRQPARTLCRALGLTDRTVRYRLARGLDALTETLRMKEVEAARSLGAARATPVQERIFVDGQAPARGVADLLAELRALVGGDDGTLRISPQQLEAVARYSVAELVGYRLGRIAEWCLPRYRLDSRFVELSLLVDLGEESQSGRWKAREERFTDLRAVLAAVDEPAVVLLGPPGSGKSTLLRRLELDLSRDALGPGEPEALGPGEPEAIAPLSFLISLNQYQPPAPGAALPAPREWLAERWAARFPKLPPLPELARARPLVYLLDGLNEMPHRSAEDYRVRIALWRQFLLESVTPGSGHRAVIACRSLDYSAPLSTPALRVPQVQLEKLSDAKVEAFLQRYSPDNAGALWEQLRGTELVEAARWPFFLRLVVEAAAETGRPEGDLAALLTAYVRRALLREVERGNPLLEPGGLVDARDFTRVVSRRGWRTSYELPEGGGLFRGLSALAHGMQVGAIEGESSQVRVGWADALAILDGSDGAAVLQVGGDLGLVDEDRAADEVMFQHQLVQEYFAARRMALEPNVDLVRQPWRASEIHPSVGEVIDSLGPGEALPPLPGTGWEETARMAAVMAGEPARFLADLAEANLALAGRAATQPELKGRLPEDRLDALRWALVKRSRNPEADLRDRIACGLAVGDLGDPRFERRVGPFGEYLMPPLVAIPGGVYPIGDDEPIEWPDNGMSEVYTETAHMPRHDVEIAAFSIGMFPVTNTEWRCFMEAGGYEDERWWDTDGARAWRRGEMVDENLREHCRYFRKHLLKYSGLLDQYEFNHESQRDLWREWMALDDEAFEVALDAQCRMTCMTEPKVWRHERFNAAAQPVVGVCWYEARAYCNWLGAQTGLAFRLPTEVEWEVAARGFEGRTYAFGEAYDLMRGNTRWQKLKRPSPVGVFEAGDTSEGVADMAGNVLEWTGSLWGQDIVETPHYTYPYFPEDGRENAHAPPDCGRVLRGGSFDLHPPTARAAYRDGIYPGGRDGTTCLRVVVGAARATA
jgi:formylglycine-generating enzyme required for sulfatase activity